MTNMRTRFAIAGFGAAILLLSMLVPASAQDYDRDPPARAGRIGYIQGSVSFQPGGEGEWLEAVPNRPLTTGDNLWSDRDSRAEVQIGSTAIRLGPETSITFLELNDITQIRLSMGSLFFRVRRVGSDNAFEVDTPNLAFNVSEPGEYRLDVNENGDQTIARVWRGDAEITGGGSSYRLTAGQEGTFFGVDILRYEVGELGSDDEFSRWCLARDERADRLRSSRYVSTEITGYEDLDDYGRWHNVPDYGYVWTPVGVPYGWAPYRFGHWVYVWPWGWTWVEDEPWGFAPFHYGRWAFIGGSWCWVPGPVAVVPVYSPALVVFMGGGGFRSGVGWFPLAPGEVFVPWYRTSPRYVQNVNITNTHVTVVQVTNVYNNVTVNRVNNIRYVNQRVNNSVTVVNRETFVNARPVANSMIRVDRRQIESAPVTHEAVRTIQPQRQSVIGVAQSARVAPPAQAVSRPVVATREPVMMRRPVEIPGADRTVTTPPVRTVRAAPPSEARPLQAGARGATAGGPNAPAAIRPGAPENNRGAAPQFGRNPRTGAPENPGRAPRAEYPQPGTRENPPSIAAPPRPPNPEDYPGSPSAPDNNRPVREVPRPGSARPEQPREHPEQPQMRPQPPQARPEQPESNRPYARPEPGRPESPRTMPEQPTRPDNRPQSNPSQQAPPQDRRQPEPPQDRHQSAPPQTRMEAAVPETRPQPAARAESRIEPAPRPEIRPAAPPQRESRPEPPRNERGNQPNDSGRNKDKEPPKFR